VCVAVANIIDAGASPRQVERFGASRVSREVAKRAREAELAAFAEQRKELELLLASVRCPAPVHRDGRASDDALPAVGRGL
jgi:hypothetical protein